MDQLVHDVADDMAKVWPSAAVEGRYYSNGWQSGAKVAEVREVATGRELGNVAICGAEEVSAAAAAAFAAHKSWFAMEYPERQAVFRAAANIARERRADIIEWNMRESGSVEAKAAFETEVTIRLLDECAAIPSQSCGQVLPAGPGRISLARRRPLGVVGVISPFNFPLYLAMRAVAPALAMGNGVVLKPDMRTAVCGGHVIARIFEEAGLPDGLLHVLPGGAEAGTALCTDPAVSMIQFTGSTATGRHVGELAGRHLKKVSLELGGKSALIILDDADIDLAVKNAKWGCFLHQGQICMASGRVLVHSGIAERFVSALAEASAGLPVGDPASRAVALGPLIDARQRDNALSIVEDAKSKGADLVTGGSADGLFFEPTVLSGIRPGMRAYDEEMFAPVAAITTFDTDEEALRIANGSEYGLAGAVITNSIDRAMFFADNLRVGMMHVNDQTVNEDVVNPFGGAGASGNGTSIGGPANWEEFTHWQWLTMKSSAPAYPL